MNRSIKYLMLVVAVILLVTIFSGFYIVPEGKQAVITQFGRPVGRPITEAGLHFKTPFIQDATYFEKRILVWDGDPNQIPTNDKTFVYLDITARWRIADPLRFLQAVNNEMRAQSILDDILDGTVRDLVNKNNLVEIIRSSDWSLETMTSTNADTEEQIRFGRDKIAALIHQTASKQTPQYGIELVDVMFKRVNYIESVSRKVYERMISERKRIAAETRSLGEGLKAEILGKVERELLEITSMANRQAEEIKGQADAEASQIYAEAYNNDPDFYDFSQSLESYQKTVGANTKMIISYDSQFYKYLQGME